MAFQYHIYALSILDIVVVQSVSHVQLFVTPWISGQQGDSSGFSSQGMWMVFLCVECERPFPRMWSEESGTLL